MAYELPFDVHHIANEELHLPGDRLGASPFVFGRSSDLLLAVYTTSHFGGNRRHISTRIEETSHIKKLGRHPFVGFGHVGILRPPPASATRFLTIIRRGLRGRKLGLHFTSPVMHFGNV